MIHSQPSLGRARQFCRRRAALPGGPLHPQTTATNGFFPWGTLTVNLAGSFLLGVFFALAMRFPLFAGEMRLLLMCGTVRRLHHVFVVHAREFSAPANGQYVTALIYMLASLAGWHAAFLPRSHGSKVTGIDLKKPLFGL